MNINDGFVKHHVSAELFLCSTKHFVAFNCLNVFKYAKVNKGVENVDFDIDIKSELDF